MLSETALRVLEAYGGMELWSSARSIQAEVSVGGLAFTLKRRPFFNHTMITMAVGAPYSRLQPIGKHSGIAGVLVGGDVYLAGSDGAILAERRNARSYFPYGRRLLFWDDLDMAYFANYAFWNYFTFPSLLMNDQITWNETKPGVLEAEFPDSIPTHSRKQEFHIDMSSGRLLQHNYSADVISSLATAAHVITGHAEDKIPAYPSTRVVTPRLRSGAAMRGPVLIDINVHSFAISGEEVYPDKLRRAK